MSSISNAIRFVNKNAKTGVNVTVLIIATVSTLGWGQDATEILTTLALKTLIRTSLLTGQSKKSKLILATSQKIFDQ